MSSYKKGFRAPYSAYLKLIVGVGNGGLEVS